VCSPKKFDFDDKPRDKEHEEQCGDIAEAAAAVSQSKAPACEQDACCFICMEKIDLGEDEAMPLPCNNCHEVVHAKCIYEWTLHQKGDAKTCPLCRGRLGTIDYRPEDCIKAHSLVLSGFRRSFVMRPLPVEFGRMLRCYLKVLPDTFGGTRYEFWLQGASSLPYPNGPLPSRAPATGDVPLLYARHRGSRFKLRSNLDISLQSGSEGSRDYNIIASLKASVMGLEHTVTAPLTVQGLPSGGERELCAVAYEQNRVGLGVGPRKMRVCMPEVTEEETIIPLIRPSRCSETMAAQLRMDENTNTSLRIMANKEPEFVEELGAYTLDFYGRVKLASAKNFQLISKDSSLVLMQFGKILDEPSGLYTCDFRWPMSPVQAFGICLSSCIRKIGCS